MEVKPNVNAAAYHIVEAAMDLRSQRRDFSCSQCVIPANPVTLNPRLSLYQSVILVTK
jgi:hypothetical protein